MARDELLAKAKPILFHTEMVRAIWVIEFERLER